MPWPATPRNSLGEAEFRSTSIAPATSSSSIGPARRAHARREHRSRIGQGGAEFLAELRPLRLGKLALRRHTDIERLHGGGPCRIAAWALAGEQRALERVPPVDRLDA